MTRWNTTRTRLSADAEPAEQLSFGDELVTLTDGTVVEVPRNNLAAAKALLALEKHAEQRMAAGMAPMDRARAEALAAGTAIRLVRAGADVEAVAGAERAVAVASAPLAQEEAQRLAEELAQLLTGQGTERKGYVMSIARKRLLVHDLDHVRAVLRRGLGSDDPERMHGSLQELARLLGLQSGEGNGPVAGTSRA